jgi:hypothetical protein
VYLTIELADNKDVMLNLKHDDRFNFSAKDPDEIQYELHLELFGAIDVEVCVIANKFHPPVIFPSLHNNLDAGFFFAGEQGGCCSGDYMLSLSRKPRATGGLGYSITRQVTFVSEGRLG